MDSLPMALLVLSLVSLFHYCPPSDTPTLCLQLALGCLLTFLVIRSRRVLPHPSPTPELISTILRQIEPYTNHTQQGLIIQESFIKQDLIKTYAEQKGNVCGASSVASCVNYLLGRPRSSPDRVTTRDAQHIYHLVFTNRVDKQLKLLTKSVRDQQLLNSMLDLAEDKELQTLAADNRKQAFQEAVRSRLGLDGESTLQDNHRYEMLRQLAALKVPLRRTYDPSTKRSTTWAVGNDLIGICAKTLADQNGRILKVTNWMGCTNSYMNLSKEDTADQIDEQFQALKREIELSDSVLFYHIDGHYTIIYGYRVVTIQGITLSQVLTSRWGQRPKHWVDFTHNWSKFSQKKNRTLKKKSVRSCLLGWNGYKILKMGFVEKLRFVDKDGALVKSLSKQAQGEESVIEVEQVERMVSGGEGDCSDIEA